MGDKGSQTRVRICDTDRHHNEGYGRNAQPESIKAIKG